MKMKSGLNNRVGQIHDYQDRENETENQRHSTFTDTVSYSIDKMSQKSQYSDGRFCCSIAASQSQTNEISEYTRKHDLKSVIL